MVDKLTVSEDASDYAKRLAHALSPDVAGMSPVELADKLGVTRQAIDKFFRPGGSGEMKAGNHVKTSRILGVDSAWLALGEGVPRPGTFEVRWQEREVIEKFRELPPEDQEDVMELVRSRLDLARRHAGKRTADPFSGAAPRPLPAPIVDAGAPALRPKARKSTR